MSKVPRRALVSLALGGLLFVPMTLTRSAHGQAGCGMASMTGAYGVVGSGTLFGAPGAFVGTMVFDGQGKITEPNPIVLNVSGTVDPVDVNGSTYKVNNDCSGRIELFTAHHNPPRSHWHDMDITVVDGGREAYFVIGGPKDSTSANPPPGEVLSGFFKRL